MSKNQCGKILELVKRHSDDEWRFRPEMSRILCLEDCYGDPAILETDKLVMGFAQMLRDSFFDPPPFAFAILMKDETGNIPSPVREDMIFLTPVACPLLPFGARSDLYAILNKIQKKINKEKDIACARKQKNILDRALNSAN